MNSKEYIFSFDGEFFHGGSKTINDAIAEAKEYDPEAEDVYIGEAVPFDFCVSGGMAIAKVRDDAYSECGCAAEMCLEGVTKDEKDKLSRMLTDAFKQWQKETGNLFTFSKAINVEVYSCE